ncbi:MAG: molybdopterin-dependent oxidoreductase [Nitrospirae bacterium]|nr:molybdopterin-dependent oxidoreductase [Nitrospirota bacterium]
MKRDGVKYPKFANKFSRIDFEAEPLPVLCLYPIPAPVALNALKLSVCGLDGKRRSVAWTDLAGVPRITLRQPLICQIFNWSETVEWEGVRLVDVLDHVGLKSPAAGYFAFYSRDGHFFETLSSDEARDPRVLLAYGLNGQPLPLQHGAPLRLVVPFLQGYKSVKWVKKIRAFRADPMGIKRLCGQSSDARLSEAWRRKYGIEPPVETVGNAGGRGAKR